MSVKYKLVLKKDLTKGAATDAKRYYASANVTGMMGISLRPRLPVRRLRSTS